MHTTNIIEKYDTSKNEEKKSTKSMEDLLQLILSRPTARREKRTMRTCLVPFIATRPINLPTTIDSEGQTFRHFGIESPCATLDRFFTKLRNCIIIISNVRIIPRQFMMLLAYVQETR